MNDPQEVYKTWREAKEIKHSNQNLDLKLAAKLLFLKKNGNYKIITGDKRSTWMNF